MVWDVIHDEPATISTIWTGEVTGHILFQLIYEDDEQMHCTLAELMDRRHFTIMYDD